MISDDIKNKIKDLYLQKKYEELIEAYEKIPTHEEKPSALLNIIGLSYFLKKNANEKDINFSLLLFEQAYSKDKKTINGLNALKNLIILGIKASTVSKNFSKFLVKAKNLYEEAELNFGDNEEFLELGLNLHLYLLDNKKQEEIVLKILNSNKNFKSLRGQAIFMCNYYYNFSQKHIYKNSLKNCEFFSKLNVKKLDEINYRDNKKVKIGFLSCDLIRNHSTTFFLKDILKFLNKDKFETYCFSSNKRDSNDLSQNELKNLSDEWFDVGNFQNQKIVNLVQEQKIDILIDLIGFTNTERLEIFNSRVSPIQISWLAYCNTTGLKTIDYLFADNNLIYDEEYNLYSEKIVKFPEIWNSHSGFNYDRNFNKLPSLNSKNFTYGSFNNFRKISDETISIWSEILKKNKNSNLILKSSEFCSEKNLIEKFKMNGVDDRIIIFNKLDFQKKIDHLHLYKKVDLALDTFPYNGVTTTFESLWMNVPVLVLKGYNFNSRCGESIIKNAKYDYFIAKNKTEYIEKALYLSQNKEKLIDYREKIFQTILSSSLFDTKRFTQNFQNLLLNLL